MLGITHNPNGINGSCMPGPRGPIFDDFADQPETPAPKPEPKTKTKGKKTEGKKTNTKKTGGKKTSRKGKPQIEALKFKLQTVHELGHEELERFLTAHFGQEFSFSTDQELGDEACKRVVVTGELTENQSERVERWREEALGSFLLKDLLDSLASEGKIPVGTYLVCVSDI